MTVQTEQLLAQVAEELRAPLLAANRYTAPREDLEDIYARASSNCSCESAATRPSRRASTSPTRSGCASRAAYPIATARSPDAAPRPAHSRKREADDDTTVIPPSTTPTRSTRRERLRTLIAALRELPAAQRDAVLAERTVGDTDRKRRWRGRRTLLASLDGL